MQVTFVGSEKIAHNIRSFYFKPDQPVRYIAGQFIELHLPHPNKDKRGEKRWFTLSSAPSEEFLAITTKLTPIVGSSFKNTLQNLKENSKLFMASPIGDFVLPKSPQIPLIFVAGGIGCTPFRSIIAELQLSQQQRDITLLYGTSSVELVAFKTIFSKLGKKFIVQLTEPSPDWKGRIGRLSADSVLNLPKISSAHYVYLSGPEPMVETMYKDLKKQKFNKHQIYTDYFPGYVY